MSDTIKVVIECQARVTYTKRAEISISDYAEYRSLCESGSPRELDKWCERFADLHIDTVRDVSDAGEFRDVVIEPVKVAEAAE
jgi:hypothetical protein